MNSSDFLFRFPPNGPRNVLNIMADDKNRLEPGKYLNDNLCSLFTRMLMMKEGTGAGTLCVSPSDAKSATASATASDNVGQSVNIIQSFFYTKYLSRLVTARRLLTAQTDGTNESSWGADLKAFAEVR